MRYNTGALGWLMKGDSVRKQLVVLIATATTLAAFSIPAMAASADDQDLADSATLQLADVPAGFEENQVPPDAGQESACTGAIRAADEAALSAPHAASQFTLPQDQGFALIQSNVAVLAKEKAAKKALNAYQKEAKGKECFETVLLDYLDADPNDDISTEASVSAFRPEMDDKGNKAVVTGGDEYAGYYAGVRQSNAGGEPQFFEAELVIGRVGRGIFQIVIVAGGTIPADDVQAMMQAIVDRLEPAA